MPVNPLVSSVNPNELKDGFLRWFQALELPTVNQQILDNNARFLSGFCYAAPLQSYVD